MNSFGTNAIALLKDVVPQRPLQSVADPTGAHSCQLPAALRSQHSSGWQSWILVWPVLCPQSVHESWCEIVWLNCFLLDNEDSLKPKHLIGMYLFQHNFHPRTFIRSTTIKSERKMDPRITDILGVRALPWVLDTSGADTRIWVSFMTAKCQNHQTTG